MSGSAERTRSAIDTSTSTYKYIEAVDWRLKVGRIEDWLAVLVYDITEVSPLPAYFMLLTWRDSQVAFIRDYRSARYVLPDAQIDL